MSLMPHSNVDNAVRFQMSTMQIEFEAPLKRRRAHRMAENRIHFVRWGLRNEAMRICSTRHVYVFYVCATKNQSERQEYRKGGEKTDLHTRIIENLVLLFLTTRSVARTYRHPGVLLSIWQHFVAIPKYPALFNCMCTNTRRKEAMSIFHVFNKLILSFFSP